MPECPYCKEKINHLANIVLRHEYDLVAGEKGEPLFRFIYKANRLDEFRCPKCKAMITDSLNDATKLLNT